jgi:hypothetical protein
MPWQPTGPFTAWNSQTMLGDAIGVPNWAVAVAALAAAALVVLETLRITPRTVLVLLLAVYGITHTVIAASDLLSTNRGFGVGPVLTIAGFGAVLCARVMDRVKRVLSSLESWIIVICIAGAASLVLPWYELAFLKEGRRSWRLVPGLLSWHAVLTACAALLVLAVVLGMRGMRSPRWRGRVAAIFGIGVVAVQVHRFVTASDPLAFPDLENATRIRLGTPLSEYEIERCTLHVGPIAAMVCGLVLAVLGAVQALRSTSGAGRRPESGLKPPGR